MEHTTPDTLSNILLSDVRQDATQQLFKRLLDQLAAQFPSIADEHWDFYRSKNEDADVVHLIVLLGLRWLPAWREECKGLSWHPNAIDALCTFISHEANRYAECAIERLCPSGECQVRDLHYNSFRNFVWDIRHRYVIRWDPYAQYTTPPEPTTGSPASL